MSKAGKTPAKAQGRKDVKVTKDMVVRDIITLFPTAADIMASYGIHCFSCSIGGVETLEQGCQMHGIDDVTLSDLLTDINEAIQESPKRPETLTVTEEAGKKIREIAEKEGRINEGLSVVLDSDGAFCMEFRDKPDSDEKTFQAEGASGVHVFVSTLTLSRIGGGAIDFREGRFKLDLMDDKSCGCHSGECGCVKEEGKEKSC